MSHYNVNGGVPKTLIQHLIRWVVSSKQFDDEVGTVLVDVLHTEITPELVPSGEDEQMQSSEAKVGPGTVRRARHAYRQHLQLDLPRLDHRPPRTRGQELDHHRRRAADARAPRAQGPPARLLHPRPLGTTQAETGETQEEGQGGQP
jgi:hypothetical protein